MVLHSLKHPRSTQIYRKLIFRLPRFHHLQSSRLIPASISLSLIEPSSPLVFFLSRSFTLFLYTNSSRIKYLNEALRKSTILPLLWVHTWKSVCSLSSIPASLYLSFKLPRHLWGRGKSPFFFLLFPFPFFLFFPFLFVCWQTRRSRNTKGWKKEKFPFVQLAFVVTPPPCPTFFLFLILGIFFYHLSGFKKKKKKSFLFLFFSSWLQTLYFLFVINCFFYARGGKETRKNFIKSFANPIP